MLAFLINLDRSPERLADADAILKSAGIAYKRVSAVDGRKMSAKELASRCSRWRFFLANARRVKIGEVACALSHTLCWKRLLASQEARAVVFEDDVAVDAEKYAEALRQIERDDDGSPAVWLLHHRNLVPDPGKPDIVRLLGTPREALTCWGTESYVLNRAAAELLLKLQTPIRYIADAWSTYARRGVDVRVVFPTSCKVRNIGSEIVRRTTGRAGWKWYLAFGRFKYRVAFHLDNLLHAFVHGGWRCVWPAGLAFALVAVDLLIRFGGVEWRLGWWAYLFKRAFVATLPLWALPFVLRRMSRWIVPVLFVWIVLVEALELFLRLNFNMVFKGDLIMVIAGTSKQEVSEFLSLYVGWGAGALVLLGVAALATGVWWLSRRSTWTYPRRIPISLGVGAVLIAVFALLGGKVRYWMFWDLPYDCLTRFAYYTELSEPEIGELAVDENRVPLTVFVVGESASRDDWQLYGYNRDTTPCLQARKDQLVVFEDLLAPWSTTLEVMRMLFTRATIEAPGKAVAALPQVLAAAGYRTILLSAQTHCSQFEKIEQLPFSGCERLVYLDDTDPPPPGWDERLLPLLDCELANATNGPLVAILHLEGSHSPFDRRFPRAAARFSAQAKPGDRADDVDFYDDSIRYTDSLLERMIVSLEHTGRPAVLIYLSDHGETPRAPSWRYLTDGALWRVPFVIWCSESYRKAYPERMAQMQAAKGLPLQGDRLFDGLLHVLGVRCKGFEKEDFLSESYERAWPRKIENGQKTVLEKGTDR